MDDSGPLGALQIVCGGGQRRFAISTTTEAMVSGIEPSTEANTHALSIGLDVHVGAADELPFVTGQFNVLILAFVSICVIVKTCFAWQPRQISFFRKQAG